ncbi:hypothetical protein GmHk_18G051864 [Glycine max]|nr:hypothetical protein GmHk_18G051864 [Glycine max]
MHSVTYNQDLSVFLLTIFKSSSEPKPYPKWSSLYHQVLNSATFKVLLTEYKVTYNSLDVLSTIYSFMKATGFTHLNLEGTTECIIVYNHWKKTAKIGNGWRNLCTITKFARWIIFEFPDATSNFVLFWICL